MTMINVKRRFEKIPEGEQILEIVDVIKEGNDITLVWENEVGAQARTNYKLNTPKGMDIFVYHADIIVPYKAGETSYEPSDFIGAKVKCLVTHYTSDKLDNQGNKRVYANIAKIIEAI